MASPIRLHHGALAPLFGAEAWPLRLFETFHGPPPTAAPFARTRGQGYSRQTRFLGRSAPQHHQRSAAMTKGTSSRGTAGMRKTHTLYVDLQTYAPPCCVVTVLVGSCCGKVLMVLVIHSQVPSMRTTILPQAAQGVQLVRIPSRKDQVLQLVRKGKAQKDDRNRKDVLPQGAPLSPVPTLFEGSSRLTFFNMCNTQHVSRRFKNGFREGTTATRKSSKSSAPAAEA